MFSDDQMRALFERTFERLLKAGWLHQVILTDGKGWHLIWTPLGTEKAMVLRRVIDSHSLAADDRAPMAFHKFLQGQGLPLFSHWKNDRTLADYWLQCLQDLSLEIDGDELLGLVHVIKGWGPH